MVCFTVSEIRDNSDIELSKKLGKPFQDIILRDIYESMESDKRDLVESIVLAYYNFCKCTDMEKNVIVYLVDSIIREMMKGYMLMLNLEHVKNFIGYYHQGDYVYDQVLHREFKEDYDTVVNYLVDNNIVEVFERLVCPECRQFIPEGEVCGEIVCYHCGRIYSVDSVIHEKIFIKL